jgi:glycosyltransferase involved in cell wall biosynthesis
VRLLPVAVDFATLRPADLSSAQSATTDATIAADAAMQVAFDQAYAAIAARAGEHDLIHAHAYDLAAFTNGAAQPLPIAHTLHMPDLHTTISAALAHVAPANSQRTPGQPWLATVSRWCADTYAATCRIDTVIPNGIDLDAIPFGARAASPSYLLYAGRIAPEKGAADAIAIARAAGVPLRLVGGVYNAAYFSAEIEPWLTREPEWIHYLGSVSHEEVWALMAGALAVLVPSRWEEPFGLAACEAQAAGAPVIGYARGGLRDIVASGETGALVAPGDIAAAAAGVAQAARLDRRACRERMASRYTLASMAAGYERLYAQMLGD